MALEKARRHAKDDIGIVARGAIRSADKDAARGAFTVATVGGEVPRRIRHAAEETVHAAAVSPRD